MQVFIKTLKRYNDTTNFLVSIIKEAEINLNQNYIVFCEDKLSLNIENNISDVFLGNGAFNVKVYSFARFLSKNTSIKNALSKEGSAMIIKKIILENKSVLKCFNKNLKSKNLALTIYETIAQLRSAKVTPYLLEKFNSKYDILLNNKLNDIVFIYKKYIEFLAQGYFDESSFLELLPGVIDNSCEIKGAKIYLAGYTSFTKQALSVVESLIKNSNSLYGIFCGGKEDIYINEAEQSLDEICKKLKIIPTFLTDNINLEKENFAILSGLFNPLAQKNQKVSTNKIMLFEAKDLSDELKFICQRIKLEIIENHFRYKDISVAYGNILNNEGLIKKIFNEYEIPFFLDENKTILEHPLAKFIISYIDMIASDFFTADTTTFFKNIFFDENKFLTDKLENFILAFFDYRAGIKHNFKNKKIEFSSTEKNEFTAELLNTFIEFQNRILNNIYIKKNMTASEFVAGIKLLLQNFDVENKIITLSQSLKNCGEFQEADYNNQILNTILNILNEIDALLGNSTMEILEFKDILQSGFISKKISLIPTFIDAVFITDFTDSKTIDPKILFCANLNSDIPFNKADTALLSDRDIDKLKNFNLSIEPKIEIVNLRARQNAAITLATFKNKLILSYPLLDLNFNESRKSEMLIYFKNIFNFGNYPFHSIAKEDFLKLEKCKTQDNYFAYRYSAQKAALVTFYQDISDFKKNEFTSLQVPYSFLTAVKGSLLEQKANAILNNFNAEISSNISYGENLFFKNNLISASALEEYFNCPYKSFLSRGLKLQERQQGFIKANDSGNFLHKIMEKSLKVLDNINEEDVFTFCKNAAKEILKKEPFSSIAQKNDGKLFIDNLIKESERILLSIKKQNANTKFRPIKEELSFGYASETPPLTLNANKTLFLGGFIDRVDKADNYFRIIDYKSGKIDKLDISEKYFAGIKLQLWLYLNTLKSSGEPAGAYYFDLNNDFIDNLEENNYQMTGVTVLEDKILQLTDNNINLETDNNFCSVNVKNKKGKISGDCLEKENFDRYIKYSILLSEKAINNMLDGKIAASPYEKCGYCNFNGMCGFDKDINNFRKVKNITLLNIADAVKLNNLNIADAVKLNNTGDLSSYDNNLNTADAVKLNNTGDLSAYDNDLNKNN